MKYWLTILGSILFLEGRSQDSLLYKNRIDSLLGIQWKKPLRKSVREGATTTFFCFNHKTKQLLWIDVVAKESPYSKTIWVLQFSFINDELVRICKWNNKGINSKDRKIAFYYFNKENLLHREEMLVSIEDINSVRELGLRLQSQASEQLN